MLTLSRSFVSQFKPQHTGVLRYGQEFHQWARLDKITNEQDKFFCDKLYQAGDALAKAMIDNITDFTQ